MKSAFQLKFILSAWVVIGSCFSLDAQHLAIDSLQNEIKTATHDSTIINAWREWDKLIYKNEPELDRRLNEQIDSLTLLNLEKSLTDAEALFFLEARSFALNNLGVITRKEGNFKGAIDLYKQSLEIRRLLGDMSKIASALNNLANVYHDQGNLALSLNHNLMALKIRESLNDSAGIGTSLINIGLIYKSLGDTVRAIGHYTRSLSLFEELGSISGISTCENNIASILVDQGKLDEALACYYRTLELNEQIGSLQGTAASLNNLGTIYLAKKDFEKAKDYISQSIEIKKQAGDRNALGSSLNSLGEVYRQQGNCEMAIVFSNQALVLAQEIGNVTQIKTAAESLRKCYSELKRYKEALEMFELFVAMRDSIKSDLNQQEIIRQEFQYNYDKQAAADSVAHLKEQEIQEEKIARQKAEIHARKNQQYALFGGLGILMLFAGFMYNRFRVTQHQNRIIEVQKRQVELQKEIVVQKNHEILDSIRYAKRIQEAILPSMPDMRRALKDGFVLYLPKDVVAGDFYWLEQQGSTVYFAAADCTGHGVPGAMVSVVCSNALSMALIEESAADTGQLLDKTRDLVIQRLAKSGELVHDGMDISVCAIDFGAMQMMWSGANNPLWIVRDQQLIEYPADKQPIGKYARTKPFTAHHIPLRNDDSIYIFTDGLQDQFGGEKGKKFKAANFKKLILSVQNKEMDRQKVLIKQSFEKWRGSLEQVDDICVIGVRVKEQLP